MDIPNDLQAFIETFEPKHFQIGASFIDFFILEEYPCYAYYIRYLKWVRYFNELGRYYDPEGGGQVYTTAGFVWIVPTQVSLAFCIWYQVRLLGNEKDG